MRNDTVKPEQLITEAIAAQATAYAPYSGFQVGAALLANERVFVGGNVENVSYGLTMCAERVAVGSSLAAGCREFQTLAIASRGGVLPCGACRQVLAEFEPTLMIYLVDSATGESRQLTLQDIFPQPFQSDELS